MRTLYGEVHTKNGRIAISSVGRVCGRDQEPVLVRVQCDVGISPTVSYCLESVTTERGQVVVMFAPVNVSECQCRRCLKSRRTGEKLPHNLRHSCIRWINPIHLCIFIHSRVPVLSVRRKTSFHFLDDMNPGVGCLMEVICR